MAMLLLTISEVFEINGRGSVPFPGVSWDMPVSLKVGQLVELRRPNGPMLRVEIGGIEHLTPNPHKMTPLLFNLPRSELPIGTEIWTLN